MGRFVFIQFSAVSDKDRRGKICVVLAARVCLVCFRENDCQNNWCSDEVLRDMG